MKALHIQQIGPRAARELAGVDAPWLAVSPQPSTPSPPQPAGESTTFEPSASRPLPHPLLRGEGRGEGKHDAQPAGTANPAALT